jgi:predicted O-methyltransferase YrrM
VSLFPGEHYPFLAALVEIERPDLAIEVGTYTGMGALVMQTHLPSGGSVVTYDIRGWRTFPETLLRESDFDDHCEQRLGDLSDRRYFDSQLELLRAARLIFVDGPKDGDFEPSFLGWLLPELAHTGALVMLDDIRLLTMVELWRRIPVPKLDVTTFGHWTGTGLLDLS